MTENLSQRMSHRPLTKRRNGYLLATILLLIASYGLQDCHWDGSQSLHTLMETVATVLALMVGVLALIRYFSQEDNQFLYIGSGFLGTAFLDAYHTIVTSAVFQPYMPSDYPHLVPWSWIASRLFLSVMLFVSWLVWYRHRQDPGYRHKRHLVFATTAVATLACFLVFTLLPLPIASQPDWFIPRPFDFVPAVFFLLALMGYLRKGIWHENDFEHWLIASLIVGLATQTTFMPFSAHVDDTVFNVSHLLKKFSYILVMVGLFINLYQNYKALERETNRRIDAESKIRDSEQRYRALFNNNPAALFVIAEQDWRFLEANEKAIDQYGFSREELGKMVLQDICLQVVEPARETQMEVSKDSSSVSEAIHRRKDGGLIDVMVSLVPILYGKTAARIAFVDDVTERKAAALKLAEEENRLRLVLNSTAEAIFALDAENKCLFVNQSCLEKLGYDHKEELIGKCMHPLIHHSHPNGASNPITDCPLNHAILNGQELHVALDYFWRKDGSYFPVEYWSRPYTGNKGSSGAIVNFVDITTRQEQERQFRLADQALRHANAATYLANVEGRLVDVNSAACKMLGYRRDELLTLSVADIDAETTPNGWREHVDRLKQRETIRMESCHVSKQGSRIPVELSMSYFESYGEAFVLGLATDITERKLMELEAKQYQAIVESSEDAIIAKNLAGIVTNWNPGAEKIFGYSASEMVGQPVTKLFPQDLLEQEALILNRIGNGETVDHFEARRICKNGEAIYVSATISPIYDAAGQIIGASKIARDITKHKQTETELEAYRLNLEELVASRTAQLNQLNEHLMETQFAMDSVGIGIHTTDFDTAKFIYVNRFASEILGYSQEEFLQLRVADIDPNFPMERYHEIKQAIRQQGQMKLETVQRTRTNQTIPVEVNIFYQNPGQHSPAKLIAFVTDISQRKETENALKQAKELAETAAQVKAQFLANMSHEIRTPMNAVLGFCSLLEQRLMDLESLQLVRKIHSAGRSLLSIINEILDFSKIEAGRLEIANEPFRLSDMLDELAVLMNVYASRKKLEFTIIPPNAVDGLIGDRQRIQQVLVNLLGNAIKFTDQGEVVLHIGVSSTHDDQEVLSFSVRDTGIGISPETQVEIFSAFSQADLSISRRFGGTGLGLAISRQLVAMMGGSLTVESQLGVGSEFSFVLPLQRTSIDQREPAQRVNLKLLIADDCATARDALLCASKNLGWQAEAVDSGEAALIQVLAHWEDQNPYDVLLLDWQMPGQDGLVTAQTIQESFWQKRGDRAKMPIIIMVTAFDQEELMAQPGLAWVDHVLSKPVTTSSLYDAVGQLLHQRNSSLHTPNLANADDNLIKIPGVRILVVDDSELNLELAQLLLENNGAIVQCVANGQEALNWLAIHPTDVDIILMDVQMPVMDGYSATKLIRQDPRWQQLPVVALSAGVLKEERDTALTAGMDDFVAKPLDVDQLITTIQRLTGCRPQPLVSDQQNEAAHIINKKIPHLPGIDVKFAMKQWHDVGLYLRHLHKFVSDYQPVSNTLTELLAKHEMDAATKLLHKLKGVAGNLALTHVAVQAQSMELMINSGSIKLEAMSKLRQLIDQVCTDIGILEGILQPRTSNQPSPQNDLSAVELLKQLLTALDQDNPAEAEPIITQLQGQLAEQTLIAISDQLEQFHFRIAEKMVKDAILAIESQDNGIN